MKLKHKKIEELNKKYNTSEVCRGVPLKGTFVEMIKQLELFKSFLKISNIKAQNNLNLKNI